MIDERALTRRGLLQFGLLAFAARVATADFVNQESHSATAAFRISLAQWSLHRTIREGTLDSLDFPRAARSFGISGVEYVNSFYRNRPIDGAWVKELKTRCNTEGVESLLIMCDGEGDLGHRDAAECAKSVVRHGRWLDAAAELGCHSIRVNARSEGSPEEQTERLVDGLGGLCDRAKPLGLNVIVENHGGQSSDGTWLAATLRAVGRTNIGALPDFGNFKKTDRDWCDRYLGVAALAPLAKAVSAKSYDFDRTGNETTIDYGRMLDILRAEPYRGWIGIEYEGERLSEAQGIVATRDLLMRLGCKLG